MMEMRLTMRLEERMELRLEMILQWKCDLCKRDDLRGDRDFQTHVDKIRLCGNCILRVISSNLERKEVWMLRSINTRRGGRREAVRPTYKEYKNWFEEHPEDAKKLEDAALLVNLYSLGYRPA